MIVCQAVVLSWIQPLSSSSVVASRPMLLPEQLNSKEDTEMISKQVIQSLIVCFTLVLAACSSTPPTAPIEEYVPSFEEYYEESDIEARLEFHRKLTGVTFEKGTDDYEKVSGKHGIQGIAQAYNFLRYALNMEVCYENGSCVKRNEIARKAAVWDEHSTGVAGIQTSAVSTFNTDDDGVVVNDENALMSAASHQSGPVRAAGEVFGNMLVSGVSNAWAADIAKCKDCISNMVISEVVTNTVSGANLGVNQGCASGSCPVME